jgi:hypothetical protein
MKRLKKKKDGSVEGFASQYIYIYMVLIIYLTSRQSNWPSQTTTVFLVVTVGIDS